MTEFCYPGSLDSSPSNSPAASRKHSRQLKRPMITNRAAKTTPPSSDVPQFDENSISVDNWTFGPSYTTRPTEAIVIRNHEIRSQGCSVHNGRTVSLFANSLDGPAQAVFNHQELNCSPQHLRSPSRHSSYVATATAADSIPEPRIIKIYTDWANHYLEKSLNDRRIKNIQRDLQDSLLLVDVIEAVTNQKVPGIKQKPKSSAQSIENVAACIAFVQSLGVNTDGLTAKGIREGQLKEILGLFFSLSRYKQQQKAAISIASASPNCQSPSLQSFVAPPPYDLGPTSSASLDMLGGIRAPSTATNKAATTGYAPSALPQATQGRKPLQLSAPSGIAQPSTVPGPSGSLSAGSQPSQLAKPAVKELQQPSGLPSVAKPSKQHVSSALPQATTASEKASSAQQLAAPSAPSASSSLLKSNGQLSAIPSPSLPAASSRLPAPSGGIHSRTPSASELKQPSKLATPSKLSAPSVATSSGTGTAKAHKRPSLDANSVPTSDQGHSSAVISSEQSTTMLEKFRLFAGSTGKPDKVAVAGTGGGLVAPSPRSIPKSSTRASNSSSGFSSGKSELSDFYESAPPHAINGKLQAASAAAAATLVANAKESTPPAANGGGVLGSPKAALKAAFSKKKSPKLSKKELAVAPKATEPAVKLDQPLINPKIMASSNSQLPSNGKKQQRVDQAAIRQAITQQQLANALAHTYEQQQQRSSKNSDDADSAYAGCDSSSQSSNSAPIYVPPPVTSSGIIAYKTVEHGAAKSSKSAHACPAPVSSPDSVLAPPSLSSQSSNLTKMIPKPTMAVKGTKQAANASGLVQPQSSQLAKSASANPHPCSSKQASTSSASVGSKIAKSSSITSEMPAAIASSTLPASTAAKACFYSAKPPGDATGNATLSLLPSASSIPPPPSETAKFLENYKAVRSYSSAGGFQAQVAKAAVGIVSPISQPRHNRAVEFPHKGDIDGAGILVGPADAEGEYYRSAEERLPNKITVAKQPQARDLNASFDSLGGHQSDSNSSHSGNQSDTVSVIFCPSSDEKVPPTALNKRPTSKRESSGSVKSALNESEDQFALVNVNGIAFIRPPSVVSSSSSSGGKRLSSSSGSNNGRSSVRLETTFDTSDEVITHELPESKETSISKDSPTNPEADAEESELMPMQPISNAAGAYLRSLTDITKGSLHLSPNNKQAIAAQEYAAIRRGSNTNSASRCNADNRQLLASSKPVTSSKSLSRQPQPVQDNSECLGYFSDVDPSTAQAIATAAALASSNHSASNMDGSGYLSEGAASIYAQRLQARFREGMEAVRDSMEKPEDLVDDSFEDSSSVSSGISEAIDEISTDDLTGSSLSDQALNGSYPPGHGKPPISNASGSSKQRNSQPGTSNKAVAVETTKASRKSDSSQQTMPVSASTKLAEQYNQERIEQLLQKSRTSSRSRSDASEHSLVKSAPTANGKGLTKPFPQVSDGLNEVSNLRSPAVTGKTRNQLHQQSQHQQQYQQQRIPLMTTASDSRMAASHTSNQVPIMQQANVYAPAVINGGYFPRPGSAAGNHYDGRQLQQPNGSFIAGYHSLDRKKHLYNQCSNGGLDPNCVDELMYNSDVDGYVSFRGNNSAAGAPRAAAGSALALFSPGSVRRHGPILSLPMPALSEPHGSMIQQPPNACWNRNGNGSAAMTRSLIENNLQQENSLKLSPVSDVGERVPQANENRYHYVRAGIPLPPSQTMQQGCTNGQPNHLSFEMLSQAASMNSSGGRNYESPYANYYASTTIPNNGSVNGAALSPNSQKLSISATSGHNGEPLPSLNHSSLTSPRHMQLTKSNAIYASSVLARAAANGSIIDEDPHASTLSLNSSASGYSTVGDKCQAEVRRLHREVETYKDKVQTLTKQQCTYAHVVSAFEQSLNSMKNRIMNLTTTSVQKDQELQDLKEKFDTLRQISATAGINVDHVFSPRIERRHTINETDGGVLIRHPSSESINSAHSETSQRSSLSTTTNGSGGKNKDKLGSDKQNGCDLKRDGKKTWLRSSFTKAFTRSSKKQKQAGTCGSISDVEDCQPGAFSSPCTPMHTPRHGPKPATSSTAIHEEDPVCQLQKKLQEKDSVLTDVRLEAMTSAQQVDQLRETINKLKSENAHLRQHNERLRAAVTGSSRASSHCSGPASGYYNDGPDNFGIAEMKEADDDVESISSRGHAMSENLPYADYSALLAETQEYSHRIRVAVIGMHGNNGQTSDVLIGAVCIGATAEWGTLDKLVTKLFQSYVLRVDPESNLGLSAESLVGYALGSISRKLDGLQHTERSFAQYMNKHHANPDLFLKLTLKGAKQSTVDSLAFETLIPKSLVQRYMSLLLEHRRVILSGPCGNGKSYLAQKLAEYLVLRHDKRVTSTSIATLNAESKSSEDLKKYLAGIAEQSVRLNKAEDTAAAEMPSVIIIDNLHCICSLSDAFDGFVNVKHASAPFIIGTMNQATKSTTSLQLHHNFRIILLKNQVDPVKGLLSRYLRRRFIEEEVRRNAKYPVELQKVVDWLPKVWSHLNKFIETVSSTDVTIGPRLFLGCPFDLNKSRDWFVELWNYSIVPYLIEAGKEGLQLYGKRASVEDPTDFLVNTWPWFNGDSPDAILQRVRAEDLADSSSPPTQPAEHSADGSKKQPLSFASNGQDPLLSMLIRLQQSAKSNTSEDATP